MRYALFTGCQVPSQAPQYEKASRLVLKKLGVDLTAVEFNCCGYPLRHQHFNSYLLAAARNMALAEARGINILTLCKCCLGTLKHAQSFLAARPDLLNEVQQELAEEGLQYQGRVQVRHLQTVLHDDVGLDKLREASVRQLSGLRVATLYGCHALRPSRVTGFDANPYAPSLIEDLLEVTGATCVSWDGKLKCCGAPQREVNPELSLAIIGQRFAECQASGADVLNVDCSHTLMQFAWGFDQLWPGSAKQLRGIVLYPQLLGMALGLPTVELGLDENRPRAGYLRNFLSPRTPAPAAPEPKKAEAQPPAN